MNYYSGVTLKDLMGFTEHYALNSRLVKENGQLVEEVYRAGTPDGKVPPGLYARELGLAIRDLQQALALCSRVAEESDQRFDPLLPDRRTRPTGFSCGIDWVHDKSNPDFSNGFVEVYKDPRGQKGAMQGFVTIVDEKMNKLMTSFAAECRLFRAARSVARQVQESESQAAGRERRRKRYRDRRF